MAPPNRSPWAASVGPYDHAELALGLEQPASQQTEGDDDRDRTEQPRRCPPMVAASTRRTVGMPAARNRGPADGTYQVSDPNPRIGDHGMLSTPSNPVPDPGFRGRGSLHQRRRHQRRAIGRRPVGRAFRGAVRGPRIGGPVRGSHTAAAGEATISPYDPRARRDHRRRQRARRYTR